MFRRVIYFQHITFWQPPEFDTRWLHQCRVDGQYLILANLAKLGCACLQYTTFDYISGGSRTDRHPGNRGPLHDRLEGHYDIDGHAFVYTDRASCRVVTILGY